MKNLSRLITQGSIDTVRRLFRLILGLRPARERVLDDAGSYVGLFQGVIETDGPDEQILPLAPDTTKGHSRPPHRPLTNGAARTSGFLRLEVNDRKKATGCFLFFVDGKILSGNIEGASEQKGFVEASFRLDTDRADASGRTVARPVAAIGKLHLEARHARGASVPGEDLTIRFV